MRIKLSVASVRTCSGRIYLLFITVFCVSTFLFAKEEVPLQDITVRHGDTLWSVANKYLKDPKKWPEILKYNRINSSDPNVILPGMVLKIPVLLIKEHLRYALLISILNDVRYRRNKEVSFLKAKLDMELYNNDALRTFKKSQAQIKFYSGELLRIDENSFIIIRPEEKQEEVELLNGAVRASRTKVLTEDTVVMPRVTPQSPNPDFKTRLKKDKTTIVEVYEGLVDVTAQGKTVRLTKGFGTEVKHLKPPSSPKKLPPLPEMVSEVIPGTGITAQTKLTSYNLSINLKPPNLTSESNRKVKVLGQLINQYHLQVSSDREFKKIVLDEINPLGKRITINFKNKNIPDGIYYYRIAYMDELGFEGQFTQPNIFNTDSTPPVIEILKPDEGEFIQSKFISVVGKTEPGCLITINERNVVVEKDGSFQVSLSSRKKEVILNIQAEDSFGNITKLKRSVIYMPGKNVKEGGFLSKPADIVMGIITITVIIGVVSLIF